MQQVTLVKKIMADGSPCRKCKDVMDRLERDNYIDGIDRIVIADERLQDSEGMVLARQYGVNYAPFFIVDRPSGSDVYTSYFRFVKDVLQKNGNEVVDEMVELLEIHSDLDFL
ncbi:hypothetical protein ACFL17_05125 [Pseudomonadota bacterium]